VGYADFVGEDQGDVDKRPNIGMGMFPAVLQRNNILDLSGIAINNSSTLSCDASLEAVVDRDADIFMRSLRRAVLFLETVQLEK